MSLSESAQFLYWHLTLAIYAALIFAMGVIGGVVAVRSNMRLLLIFPRWLMKQFAILINFSFGSMCVFIFLFNSVFIFLYMLTGVAHYGLTAAIDFLTGTNLGIILLLQTRKEEVPETMPKRAGLGLVCGAIVVLLELPVFWAAIAMGMSFGSVPPRAITTWQGIMLRGQTYIKLLVPVLFISAIIETIGVKSMGKAQNSDI